METTNGRKKHIVDGNVDDIERKGEGLGLDQVGEGGQGLGQIIDDVKEEVNQFGNSMHTIREKAQEYEFKPAEEKKDTLGGIFAFFKNLGSKKG